MLQGPPLITPPMAFADESFREDLIEGLSVLAAAVLEARAQQPARELMRRLPGPRRTNKLHCTRWIDFNKRRRPPRRGHGGLHVVAVCTPVPRRRQERARAACLTALVAELPGSGVQHLHIEARGPPTSTAEMSRQSRAPASPCPKAVASVLTTYPEPPSHRCGLPMFIVHRGPRRRHARRGGLPAIRIDVQRDSREARSVIWCRGASAVCRAMPVRGPEETVARFAAAR
jgi:hypothetical protein